jgi:soluble lytic murein transglycosylase
MLSVTALLIVLWTCPAGAVDLDFVAAYRKGDVRALQRYAAAQKQGLLEPYLIARMASAKELSEGRLSHDLAGALDRFAGVPPIEEVRAAVLKAWAGKGQWDRFAAHVDRVPEWLTDRDRELQCAKIAFLRSRQQPVSSVRPVLFAQLTEFPPLCAAAFAGAAQTGEIAPDQALARLMYLGSVGRKSDAVRLLEVFSPVLNAKDSGRNTGAPVLEVLSAARSNYRGGIKSFEQRRCLFDAETARDVLLHIGIIGARDLEPEASALIASVDGYRRTLMPAAAEWRTKAALLSGAWGDVAASIESMPLPLRDEPAWRYWHARALENLSRTEESRIIYADLSGHPGYYGILAAERLGLEPPYLSQTFAADLSLLRRFEDRPETARALALHKSGLWIEAARELNIMLRGADSATLYAAALFAKERGLPDRQISLAQRASDHVDLPLRYPLPYRREIADAAGRTGLSPELLWAVIRQESRFVVHAVSPAGAVGLMQVMPSTAKSLSATRGKSRSITPAALMEPDTNISLGSTFLKSMHRRYDGNWAFAAAAYNAGPGRVDRWQRQLRGLDIERFIEMIPFTETRDYTKQVLANFVFYAYVLGKDPVSLSSLAAKKI